MCFARCDMVTEYWNRQIECSTRSTVTVIDSKVFDKQLEDLNFIFEPLVIRNLFP